MSNKIIFTNENDIVSFYLEGFSEKSTAKQFKVDRGTIRKVLLRNGVKPRNRSEAMYLRMSQATPAERSYLARKAHDALRGVKRKESELIQKAITRQNTLQYVGMGEDTLNQWLIERGLKTIPQLAVDRFNIDIAIPPIAVELMIASCDPLLDRYNPKKIKYLTNNGWAVVYIHIKRLELLSEVHANQIMVFCDLVSRDPSYIGQYWVIGSDAQIKATGRFDMD